VVLVLGLAVLLNYVDRGSLATAAPVLQNELSLSSSQLGLLLSAFFWVYAPAQLFAGWLVHRFNIRVVLAAGVLLWSAATALTGLAGGFASLLFFRLMLGLGESTTFPSWQLILVGQSLEHERGRANGLIGAGQGIGPMLGTFVGGLTMAYFGWRVMFVGLGLITFLWVWPWSLVTRGSAIYATERQSPPAVSYFDILGRREFWGAAVGHFCLNYAFYFLITWLPTFLVKAGGFTVPQMAGIGAAIYGIYATVTALAGALSDRWIRQGATTTRVRKTFVVAGALGAALTIACSAYTEPRTTVWLLGAAGVFFGLTPMIFAIGATLAGPRAAGRWAGAQNLAGQFAGIVAPLVTGFIIDRTGAFSLAFTVSAVSSLLAIVAWGFIIREVAPVERAKSAKTAAAGGYR
jgi:MFS family permease